MIRRSIVIMFGAYFIFIASFGIAKTIGESSTTALTADEILERMSKIYATCKTYQDSGVVKTTFIQQNKSRVEEKPFSTAFIRPDLFRYEYREKPDYSARELRYIIWSKGKDVLVWWDINPKIEERSSLGMAIAGATGVSGGSAHTIPALLLPEVGGRLLTEISETKRIEDKMLDNANCFRIEGKYGDDPIVIWIDTKSFLVRLITTRHNFPNFSVEEITTYKPVVEGEVSEKALEFDPPKQK